jgi:hypothetical protein
MTKAQGLKPNSICGWYGTTEVVPCYKSTGFSQGVTLDVLKNGHGFVRRRFS